MANEEDDFHPFTDLLGQMMDTLDSGKIYFVIDNVSTDKTLDFAKELSTNDLRFEVIWAPDNRSVVDAYLKGFEVAYEKGHELIIEMDAGMSHDPRALPMFLRVLNEGNECAFGSRFINGGSMGDSPFKRRTLSKTGTTLANILLGTHMKDMTSGYQGFHRDIIQKILAYPLRSRGHFYQTEIRYLLRNHRIFEVPIHYQAPSPRVSSSSVKNAYKTLWQYFVMRLKGNTPSI
ncbi:MAG: glycosyltransferase [Bacteroidetes bacterium]|nr:glycosyltransferase [Bacteroidota bacterium]